MNTGAQCKWEPISLYKACWIESDNPVALENFKKRKSQYMALDKEGRDVYLADSGYVLTWHSRISRILGSILRRNSDKERVRFCRFPS